jgi:hypothetical protein
MRGVGMKLVRYWIGIVKQEQGSGELSKEGLLEEAAERAQLKLRPTALLEEDEEGINRLTP